MSFGDSPAIPPPQSFMSAAPAAPPMFGDPTKPTTQKPRQKGFGATFLGSMSSFPPQLSQIGQKTLLGA